MRSLSLFSALCTLFFSFHAFTMIAQAEWIGGSPGHETDWHEASNWSTHRVPGSNEAVLIPADARGEFYPVVNDRTALIGYVLVEEGASLEVTPYGQLRIDGDAQYTFGLYLLGELNNEGLIIIEKTAGSPILGTPDTLINSGVIVLTEKEHYRAHVIDSPQAVPVMEGIPDLIGFVIEW